MAIATPELVNLSSIKTVKQVPYEEYFVSGHRTCQGCESALVMRYIAKAAGPRTIVLGSTGCMYVANTSYYTTPWVVPWMHTQLGSAGSAATGHGGRPEGADAQGQAARTSRSTSSPSAATAVGRTWAWAPSRAALTHAEYSFLVILYDNESYANTDIQLSG